MTAINYRVKDIETGRKTEMSYTPNLQDAWDWFKTSEKFTFVSDLLEFTAIRTAPSTSSKPPTKR